MCIYAFPIETGRPPVRSAGYQVLSSKITGESAKRQEKKELLSPCTCRRRIPFPRRHFRRKREPVVRLFPSFPFSPSCPPRGGDSENPADRSCFFSLSFIDHVTAALLRSVRLCFLLPKILPCGDPLIHTRSPTTIIIIYENDIRRKKTATDTKQKNKILFI